MVFLHIGSESSFRVPKEPTAVWWASRPLNTPRRHHSSTKYAFWRFPIFQNQENSRKTSRKGPYTLLWSLKGPSTTLMDMQTAQDTSVSIFFVTDVRHAFVSVHILLEWEISRKSSGKAYFTAVLGVRIQPRTLWWIIIHTIQDTLAATFRVGRTRGRYAFSPEDVRQCSAGHGHPATAGTTVSNEQLALFEKPATANRFVDTWAVPQSWSRLMFYV